MEGDISNLDGIGSSSLDNSVPTRIVLVDHTEPDDELVPQESLQAQTTEPLSPSQSDEPESSRRWPKANSLKNLKAQRKYRHFTERKPQGKPKPGEQSTSQAVEEGAEENVEVGATSDQLSDWGQTTLGRGRQRIKEKFRSKKENKKANDAGFEIDILYENQRGIFFFGNPLFSSRALNQFEPSPWVDGHHKKSRVDITNAQVPDPSWEWAWKTWYVDMGRDVDEEGWEYSFYFKGFSWHGTHPWFHSFVRRRRWIRKRDRKSTHVPDKLRDPHMMNQDYFTIHSGKLKSATSATSSPSRSEFHPSTIAGKNWGAQDEIPEEEIEISDIGALVRALKEAPVDSERIVFIKRFLEQGGDDLYYLANEIPTILSFFFYENSCRRLLGILNDKIQQATAHRDEHAKRKEAEDERESRYIESLLKSAKAVDEECRKLGFWSDVRNLPRDGKAIGASDSEFGWGHKWQGLDTNGLSNDQAPTLKDERVASEEHEEAEKQASDSPGEGATVPKNVVEEVKETGDEQDKNVEIE